MYNHALKVNNIIGGGFVLRVGIPRALLFYEFYPFWETFFEELGAKVIVSDNTTKSILDEGIKECIDEACLPVKVFYGHVLNLKDKVDYIFIPRLTSITEGEYICPKFGGLPDMIRNSIKGLPKIISTEINFKDSHYKVFNTIREIGSFFTPNTGKITKAYKKANQTYYNFKQQFKNEIPEWVNTNSSKLGMNRDLNQLNIGLLGHPYNIFDPYVNMNMVEKLNKSMVKVITTEMLDKDTVDFKASTLRKKMFWTFGRRIMGAALRFLDMKEIHGIIYLMSFGCGIDSFICDMVERRVRAAGIPFTTFIIDEHSGEAGVNTRIEAFIDMIRWRRKNESNISTYG